MKAIIIGSGIAGIATAIRLSHQGFAVHVYESANGPGGKINEFVQDGFRFDAGPSLLTLPSLIDELFTLCGKRPEDYFRYVRLSKINKYFFEDGTTLEASADVNAFAEEVNKVTGEPLVHVLNYLKKSESLYRLTAPVFLKQSLHLASSYLNWPAWKAFLQLYKLDASTSLHTRNEHSFQSEKVVQLFDRYATYNGSDPFLAPATLKVIPHLEFNTGAYFPVGGMYQVIHSLCKLATEMGVTFHFNTPVEKILIHNQSAAGVLVNKKEDPADVVVSNADVKNTYKKLLPDEKQPGKILSQVPSTSALVFYWGINKTFPNLELHNIFFSADYKREFDYLTNKRQVCNDPTIYVNISSKVQAADAPAGCENWFTMINAPYDSGQDWKKIVSESRSAIIEKLSRMLNSTIRPHIVSESILTPQDIENRTASYLGALYGSSSNNRFAAFLRHKNFSSGIRNLYFCGGSVHPGGGIPLCLLSASIVSDLVRKRKV